MTNEIQTNEFPSWQERLGKIDDLLRDMSRHTDPQAMVRAYAERLGQILRIDRRLSLSRRGMNAPEYRITRSTTWETEVNPWTEPHRLPHFKGGLLAQLVYGDQPVLIEDLQLEADEPAREFLAGHRSLLAIPMYDQGQALNMVLMLQREANAFEKEQLPDLVWRTGLFGRATSALVLKDQLRLAYLELDREMKVVGDIQRSLLPAELPQIPTLDLAAHYQPAARAGGDYYDFFPMADGRWGIIIADVSGHGTPAAVLMAVTHCIAHTHPGPPVPPGKMLEYLNQHLTKRYTGTSSTFVTAFYGIFDPERKLMTYACAGHNPPQLKRCQDGTLISLDGAGGFPLGLIEDADYVEAEIGFQTGDQIIFYTDGITEAQNVEGELFGIERLNAELENCSLQAQALMDSVLRSVEAFAQGHPADDDRTMIVARVRS